MRLLELATLLTLLLLLALVPRHATAQASLPSNAQIICPFVAMSVAPDWPADQQALMLGSCPPRPTPRRL